VWSYTFTPQYAFMA